MEEELHRFVQKSWNALLGIGAVGEGQTTRANIQFEDGVNSSNLSLTLDEANPKIIQASFHLASADGSPQRQSISLQRGEANANPDFLVRWVLDHVSRKAVRFHHMKLRTWLVAANPPGTPEHFKRFEMKDGGEWAQKKTPEQEADIADFQRIRDCIQALETKLFPWWQPVAEGQQTEGVKWATGRSTDCLHFFSAWLLLQAPSEIYEFFCSRSLQEIAAEVNRNVALYTDPSCDGERYLLNYDQDRNRSEALRAFRTRGLREVI